MKKRTLTSGAMLAALLFASANTSFAQNINAASTTARTASKMHRMHWSLSDSALTELAEKLGLNADQIAQEIKSGKTIQQALKDHGITQAQIKTAFGDVRPKDLKNFKLSDEQITALAAKLSISADKIKKEIESGKTIKDILTAHGITATDMHKVFSNKKAGKMSWNRKALKPAMPEVLQAQARVLGLTPDELTAKIKSGQKPEQIAVAQGIATSTYNSNVAKELQTMITNGTITGKKVNFFTNIIKKLTS